MGKFLTTILIIAGFATYAQEISIGSKQFSESRLLAELMAQVIESNTSLTVERRLGLGGTLIAFEAVKTGEIDIYPEYTGTIQQAILENPTSDYREELSKLGVTCGEPFGFNNTYVLVTHADSRLEKISDLRNREELKLGFSNEFLQRGDGFQALNAHYELGLNTPKGMEHGLAYAGLAERQIDITDGYSTDGKLEEYGFKFLEDDKNFFPQYLALPLLNSEMMRNYPEVMEALKRIEINEDEMQELNYRVEVEKQSIEEVASDFLIEKGLITSEQISSSPSPLLTQTVEHLQLTFLATLIAVLIAIPLGIYISQKPKLASVILSSTGVIQTIPSLALLGFMIPLFGIGFLPAVIALFLYALLPIVRNTYSGLTGTDPMLVEAAKCLGMNSWQVLQKVKLPLAAPFIMAGVRTALTINIGTATLAAFIGAGGLGESIITGISLNDNAIILRGAIPAAILALIADWGMGWIERRIQPIK
jgi:osmoprotectant transport system permease protein